MHAEVALEASSVPGSVVEHSYMSARDWLVMEPAPLSEVELLLRTSTAHAFVEAQYNVIGSPLLRRNAMTFSPAQQR